MIILDSDFIVSYLMEDQSTHEKAGKMANNIEHKQCFITNLVKYEVVNVLSIKYSQSAATSAWSYMSDIIDVVWVDTTIENLTWVEFSKHTNKNISIVDCVNVVLANKLKAKIASFDRFYGDLRVLV